jgi:hypothetical protein
MEQGPKAVVSGDRLVSCVTHFDKQHADLLVPPSIVGAQTAGYSPALNRFP